MEEINFYKPFKEEKFTSENCFLCGVKPSSKKTLEHIFPKWLQHKFDLWDQKLIVTNNSTIPYRNLTVPCCEQCNNEYLSRMEIKFQELLDNSFENLSFEDELIIFQWTAKIIYATRYKELTLLYNRKKPDLGKILSPKEIESYSTLHLFLQSIRFETSFKEFKPWSIFIFKNDNEKFFYKNDLNTFTLTMKFGKVSLVIVFEDNNCIETYMSSLKNINNLELNFAQYIEATSHIFYSALLKEKVPSYFSSFNSITNKLTVNSANSIYSRKWNDKEFGGYLDYMLERCGINRTERTYQSEGWLLTYLIDSKGNQLLKE